MTVALVKNYVLLLMPTGKAFPCNKSLIKCENWFTFYCNTQMVVADDQKFFYSSCVVIKTHNFKVFSFVLHDYHP